MRTSKICPMPCPQKRWPRPLTFRIHYTRTENGGKALHHPPSLVFAFILIIILFQPRVQPSVGCTGNYTTFYLFIRFNLLFKSWRLVCWPGLAVTSSTKIIAPRLPKEIQVNNYVDDLGKLLQSCLWCLLWAGWSITFFGTRNKGNEMRSLFLRLHEQQNNFIQWNHYNVLPPTVTLAS